MFNSYFYSDVMLKNGGYKYQNVRRVTKRRKVDLFAHDVVLFPIHVRKNHWCLAAADLRSKVLSYHDSLKGPADGCLELLAEFLYDEAQAKGKQAIGVDEWEFSVPGDVPEQHNCIDCGMFMLTNAAFLQRGLKPAFTQDHIPALRKRMVLTILCGADVERLHETAA